MKRVLFMLIGCLLFLYSCSENATYSISNYDNESRIQVEFEDTASTNTESRSLTGEFTVKEKKYTFEGTDLILLELTNKTGQNCSVTVNGSYLDKDGNVLKTETQTFDQFAVGYQNFFLFRPGLQFEKFTYTVEAEATDTIMYASKMQASLADIYEQKVPNLELATQGDDRLYPTIIAYFEYLKNTDEVLDVRSTWVLFNEKDEIIAIVPIGTYLRDELEGQQYPLYTTTEDTLVWPEDFKGNVRAIHVLTSLVNGEVA